MDYPIKFTKIWPAGNMTALVESRVPRSYYAEISRQIIRHDKSIEQVGFIEPASNRKALGRLQMMGGEFCGNATRSLALFLYERLQRERGMKKKKFALEVSGIDKLIDCEIHENDNVEISLPVSHYNADLFRTCENGTLVRLDGIQHFITDFPLLARVKPEFLKFRGYYELKREELLNAGYPASGVIYVQRIRGGLKIHPLIWVEDTGTFVFETACASGTLAAAFFETRDMKDGVVETNILQPSGLFLKTTVIKKNGRLKHASISGMAELRETSLSTFSVKDRIPSFAMKAYTLPV